MADVEARPNLFELQCGDAQVTYSTSSFAGPPQLSVSGVRGEHTFSGEEIQAVPSALGTEVTVTLESVPDLHTVTLTLLIPEVRLSAAGEERLETLGIVTTNATTIAGPPEGAAQTYEVLRLEGSARQVDF